MFDDKPLAALIAAFALFILLSYPVSATLLTGPFQVCPESTTTVATDGSTFFLSNGEEYAVPGVLQPTAQFSFSVPTTKLLQAVAAVPSLSCSGSEIYLFEIPESGQSLIPILTPLCLPERLASQCHYSGLSTSSPQQLSAYIQQSPSTSNDQFITWVNRNTGDFSSTPLTHQIDGGPALRWALSGNAAFVQHDLLSGAGGSDWMLIDMCPNSMGSRLTNFQNLGAGASAAVVQTSLDVYVARVSHPSLPGGAADVSLVDCLGPSTPPDDRARLEIQLEGDGGGLVTVAPLINCDTSGNPNRCIADWPLDHTVTLTASPHPGSTFLGWSGDCSGTANLPLVMEEEKLCIAHFDTELADLGVLASVGGVAGAGSPLQLDVSVSNSGPDAASASLTIDLPPEASFNGAGSTAGCDASGQAVTCSLGELATGTVRPVVIAATLDPDARGVVQAHFQVAGSGVDDNVSNNQQTLTFPLEARVDLSLEVRSLGDSPAGELVAWQLEIHNAGPAAALMPEASVDLPAGARLIDNPSATQIACTPPRIAPGSSALLTLVARLDDDLPAGSTLIASASSTATEIESSPGNDQGVATVTVSATPPMPAPGDLNRVVQQGDLPPGAPGPLTRLSAPAVEGRSVAFEAGYGASLSGLYLRLGDGAPSPIIDWSRMSADGTAEISSVTGPSLDNGRLAASVRLDDTDAHFYATDDCGPTSLDGQGAFGGTYRNDSAAILSTDGGERVMIASSSQSEIAVAAGDAIPGSARTFDYFSLRPGWDGEKAAFFGSTFDLSVQGIYFWDAAGGLQLLADLSTEIPGRTEPFSGFRGELDIGDGRIAFIGVDSQGREGLYLGDTRDLSLQVVADALTPTLGAGGQPFFITSFADSFPSISGNQVAFFGGAPGEPFGLYLGAPGASRLLIESGDELDGELIIGIRLGPQGFDGERLAFQIATFAPPLTFTQAIYVLELGEVEIFADGFESGDLSRWSDVVTD